MASEPHGTLDQFVELCRRENARECLIVFRLAGTRARRRVMTRVICTYRPGSPGLLRGSLPLLQSKIDVDVIRSTQIPANVPTGDEADNVCLKGDSKMVHGHLRILIESRNSGRATHFIRSTGLVSRRDHCFGRPSTSNGADIHSRPLLNRRWEKRRCTLVLPGRRRLVVKAGFEKTYEVGVARTLRVRSISHNLFSVARNECGLVNYADGFGSPMCCLHCAFNWPSLVNSSCTDVPLLACLRLAKKLQLNTNLSIPKRNDKKLEAWPKTMQRTVSVKTRLRAREKRSWSRAALMFPAFDRVRADELSRLLRVFVNGHINMRGFSYDYQTSAKLRKCIGGPGRDERMLSCQTDIAHPSYTHRAPRITGMDNYRRHQYEQSPVFLIARAETPKARQISTIRKALRLNYTPASRKKKNKDGRLQGTWRLTDQPSPNHETRHGGAAVPLASCLVQAHERRLPRPANRSKPATARPRRETTQPGEKARFSEDGARAALRVRRRKHRMSQRAFRARRSIHNGCAPLPERPAEIKIRFGTAPRKTGTLGGRRAGSGRLACRQGQKYAAPWALLTFDSDE
ncbi:hypothetical protein DFH11DRAFT_1539279 [Phellopilus nigrolimitatus]|nr:hypothetical protein DFH11DRAFT_1539279 [Phellopilus nigrolimitatus]